MAIASLETILSSDGSQFVDTVKRAREETKAFNEALSDGKRVFDATRTPAERYEAEVAKLNHLLAQGAISQDTHARALAQAGEQFGVTDKKATGFLASITAMGPAGIAASVALAGVGIATAGLAAAFDVVRESTAQAFDWVDAADESASRLGIATDSLLSLAHAASFSGLSTADLSKDLETLNTSIGKASLGLAGGERVSKALGKLGLDARKLATLSVDDALFKIADAFSEIENPAERAAIASQVFKGASAGLLNTLAQGGGAIRSAAAEAKAFGLAISTADAATVAEASDQFTKLEAAVKGVGAQIAVALSPAIIAVGEKLTDMLVMSGGFDGLSESIENLIRGMTRLDRAALGPITVLGKLADYAPLIASLAGQLSGLGLIAELGELTPEQQAQVDQAKAQQAAQREQEQAMRTAAEQAAALQEAIDSQLASIHEQTAAVGKSREEIELWKLAQAGATEEQLASVRAAQEALAATKAADEANKAAIETQAKAAEAAAKMEQEFATLTAGLEVADSVAEIDKLIAKLDDLAAAGFADAEGARAFAETRREQLAFLQEREALEKQAAVIIEQNRTAQEKFNAALADAQRLREVGAIDESTFLRERARLEKELGQTGGGGDPFASPSGKDRAVAALQRGSAEAFSAINRAGGGKKDNTEKNTAATAANTAAIPPAIRDLADAIKASAPIPVSIL